MPPSIAMAPAMSAPVTLSMLDETMGSSREMLPVRSLVRLISRREPVTPFCGRNRKSSKVFPTQVTVSVVVMRYSGSREALENFLC